MNKKVVIVLVVILVLSLIGFGIFKFTDSIKKDQEEVKMKMQNISKNYDTFNNQIDTFNDIREQLAELMNSGSIYYANFYKNANKITEVLNNYNKIRNEIVNGNKELIEDCKSYYSDYDINTMCSTFNESYQNVDEVIKKDVEAYNQTVKKYNEWTKKNKGFKEIKEYVLTDK